MVNCAKPHGSADQVIPTPLHVLGRISPIFAPFFPVFCAFSPPRRDGSNEPQARTQGQETAGTGVQTAGNTVSAAQLIPGVRNAWQLRWQRSAPLFATEAEGVEGAPLPESIRDGLATLEDFDSGDFPKSGDGSMGAPSALDFVFRHLRATL